jgi:very-short-patch-repair endonuclease
MVKHYPHLDAELRGKLRTIARQMRHEPTSAEGLLWERLRDRQLSGHKFRRQSSVDRFIADFYCSNAALIIEIDGGIHQQQIEADLEREQILSALGYRIIRFTNTQVLEQTNQVLQAILDAISQTEV